MTDETPPRDAADLDGFEADLDRWGSDMAAWPPEARTRRRALLTRSAQARALLSQQKSLDHAVTALGDHVVPAGLAARIATAVPADALSPWERFWVWLTGAFWRPAVAGCAPLLLGFILGAALPTANDRQAADQFSALASTDIYEELSDADQ